MLFTDARHPCVVSTIVGAPVPGSWFSHPMAHLIYEVASRLEDSPDLLSVPLLHRKATLVHRRLWPELFAVATSGERWQRDGLTRAESELLALVARRGQLNVQQDVSGLGLPRGRTIGDLARNVERRLLVYGTSVHSASGRHEKQLQTWASLAVERNIDVRVVPPETARQIFEQASADALGSALPDRWFPWARTG